MDPNDFDNSGLAERVLIQKGGVSPSHVPHLEITGRKRDRQFVAPELLHALGTDDTPATDEEPTP